MERGQTEVKSKRSYRNIWLCIGQNWRCIVYNLVKSSEVTFIYSIYSNLYNTDCIKAASH